MTNPTPQQAGLLVDRPADKHAPEAVNKIRIILADDHPLVLEGVRSCLETFDHIEIVGAVNNGRGALQLAAETQPDIAILDINMPDLNGLDTTAEFRQHLPNVKLLILSMHDDKEYIAAAIQYGARGYVLKDVSTREIVTAIEAIHNGGIYFSSGISEVLATLPAKSDTSASLTAREVSVLVLLAEGRSNKQVARDLDISVRTVETHRKNLKRKLEISSVAGLTRYVIENNLKREAV